MNSQNVSGNDAAKALRRLAMLYRHFAETLEAELGLERACELIAKAIDSYGAQIGREAAARAKRDRLPLEPANFRDDLPAGGWSMEKEEVDGEDVTKMLFCPLAAEWKDMDPRLSRLYCRVDPAKMEAFNPKYTYVHLCNKLDGDEVCRLVIREKNILILKTLDPFPG